MVSRVGNRHIYALNLWDTTLADDGIPNAIALALHHLKDISGSLSPRTGLNRARHFRLRQATHR